MLSSHNRNYVNSGIMRTPPVAASIGLKIVAFARCLPVQELRIITPFPPLVVERKACPCSKTFFAARASDGESARTLLARFWRQFVENLIARGHGLSTVHQYVFAAEHFGRWLGRRRINREAILRFLKGHLPTCRCKTPASRKASERPRGTEPTIRNGRL